MRHAPEVLPSKKFFKNYLKGKQDGASAPKQGKMSSKRQREVDLEDLNRSVHNNDNDSSNKSFLTSSLEGTAV